MHHSRLVVVDEWRVLVCGALSIFVCIASDLRYIVLAAIEEKLHSLIIAVAGIEKRLDDFGGRLEKLENRFELRYTTLKEKSVKKL